MKRDQSKREDIADLRTGAEEKLKEQKTQTDLYPMDQDSVRLLHELQVHQIELEMQNEELRQARNEIEEGLERYTHFYDYSPVGYFTFDRLGIIRQANLTGADLLGTERSRLIGRRFEFFISRETRSAFHALLEEVFEKKARAGCEVALHKEGDRPIYLRLQAMACGAGEECCAVALDITDLMRTEGALRKSEALLNETQQITKVGGWEYDVETKGLYWTREVYNIYEVPPEFDPSDIAAAVSFYDPEARAVIENAFFLAVKEGRPYDLELPFTTAGGNSLWIRTTAKAEIRNGKVVRVYGNIVDITERKRIENALRESEERMKLALEGTDEGIWDWDVRNGAILIDDNTIRLLGYQPGEIAFDLHWWLSSIHPDSRRLFKEALKSYRDGQSKYYELEYRIRTKTDEWKWLWTRAVAVAWDPEGNPLRFIGTHRDITQKKWAQETIKESIAEKDLLLREVHHRVKNNLQVIIGLIGMQARSAPDTGTVQMLKELQERVRVMALVHEKLYRSHSLHEIDFGHYLKELTDNLLQVFGSPGVSLIVSVGDVLIETETAITCGLITTELVTNALKYAFPKNCRTREEGELPCKICIEFTEGESNYTLKVSDNGIGLQPGFDVSTIDSLGLHLVHLWSTYQLNGSIDAKSDRGASFTICFPKRKGRRESHGT